MSKRLLVLFALFSLMICSCVPTGGPNAALHRTPYKKSIRIVFDLNDRACQDIQPALEQIRRTYAEFNVKLIEINSRAMSRETMSHLKIADSNLLIQRPAVPSIQFYRDGIFDHSEDGGKYTNEQVLAMVKDYFNN